MTHLTVVPDDHNTDAERERAISWLNVKLWDGTAGLDQYDRSVVIVEVASPDRAGLLDLVGHVIGSHPHVKPNRSTCIRVRALVEADVRGRLGLDRVSPPVLRDTPLASRSAERVARPLIQSYDEARKAGRSYQ